MRFSKTAVSALALLSASRSSAFTVAKQSFLATRTGASSTGAKTCPAASTTINSNMLFRGGSALFSTATAEAPVEVFRKDYQPLPYVVTKVNMEFKITDGKTIVKSEMTLEKNTGDADELVLDGDETSVKLISISMDGKELKEGDDFFLEPGKLILKNPGSKLETTVEIVPEENTQLSGLYKSGPMYCTQCEAMGFRRITYFPDRPDNMATFERVRIEADKTNYPVLLSNGNLIEEGETDDGSHYAVWSDPFPKPSYLFAAVAGNLGSIKDSYTTKSGKPVHLEIFSERESVDKLQYAMDSLKRSMKWDEDRFGLEYDLGIYNIVATSDFNMGAMENKGLNVFNTALVLADEKTATDSDFERVEGVVGHEYFHNWTGNRVTCRDWFQLTLKEGLTVFRDQEFSGDMNSKAVNRIENVRTLRARQFPEDNGPMKHPIRPESYISMDNFYTGTVYIKGAEIIRMYQTILSVEGFNKGMKLYFERHDGSAVTCDDFLAAMADANGVDLDQFSLWYSTPGTPKVTYSTAFSDGVFELTMKQESLSDKPLHIPISIGLLDKESGEEVVSTTVLDLKAETQTFKFDGLKGEVVPSILRDFSAPIKLVPESGEVNQEELAFLAARDTNGFNRWDAGQKLMTSLIFQILEGKSTVKTMKFVEEAFERTLLDRSSEDFSILAYAMTLPSESTLAEEMEIIDPIGIHDARGKAKKSLARKFQAQLLERYKELTEIMAQETEFKVDAVSIGRRRLRNVILDYLCAINETEDEEIAAASLAMNHFKNAKGMTDKMAGFVALASMKGKGAAARDEAIQRFYDDAEGDALVLNKWFTVQATANLPDVLERVKALKSHPDFTLKNPNRCRSLISAFSMNSAAFHAEDGKGYEFMADTILEVDKLNPQVSSRMGGSLIQWRRYDEKRAAMMKSQLERLAASKLSEDLYEIVNRGLK